MHLVGFDRFASAKPRMTSRALVTPRVAVVGNCRDFWTRGRELGVEYDRLYEIPVEIP